MSSAKLAVGVRSAAFLMAVPLTASVAQLPTRTIAVSLEQVVDRDLLDASAVGDAMIGPDGSLVIGDNYRLRLAVVDRSGRVRHLGRDGEGPGEFRNIRGLGAAPGEGFWVGDARLLRVQVFDWNGRLLRSFRYRNIQQMDNDVPVGVRPLAMHAGEDMYLYAGLMADSKTGFSAGRQSGDQTILRPASAAGGAAQPIVWAGDSEHCGAVTGSTRVAKRPICTVDALRVSADARTVVVARDLSGSGADGRIEVTVTSMDLSSQKTIDLTFRKATLSPETRAADVNRAIPAAMRFYPGFGQLAVLDDGVSWISIRREGSTGGEWLVMNRAGEPMGMARLQTGERPIAGASNFLWTTATDDDGFQVIRRYRVGS